MLKLFKDITYKENIKGGFNMTNMTNLIADITTQLEKIVEVYEVFKLPKIEDGYIFLVSEMVLMYNMKNNYRFKIIF